jgi:hypothetical protein
VETVLLRGLPCGSPQGFYLVVKDGDEPTIMDLRERCQAEDRRGIPEAN